jgi:putative DNA methylase
MTTTRKKLIEVALPLEAINKASAREKSIRHGHPSTLHLWWARRPLASARAVIFAQMVDDPSEYVDTLLTDPAIKRAANRELVKRVALWEVRKAKHESDSSLPAPGPEPTLAECAAGIERERLFKIIEDLVQWESTTNEEVLERARAEIWQSWRRACAENVDHPLAKELFDRHKLPGFHDPFAGGGALPLEAQRLGLESHATDLNPVAVLINKAMIEIPPKFAGLPPVNPLSRAEVARGGNWNGKGAQGLAEDVRHYGQWIRDEAEKRIGHLYPKVEITADMAEDRPDLKPLVGRRLTVVAWLWARTVKSPNPAFREVDVPLVSSYILSPMADKEAYVEPIVEKNGYRFVVKVGSPKDAEAAKNGTKLGRGANFQCVMSGSPIAPDHIYGEANAGRMGERLMAIVAEGGRGRVYLSPTDLMEAVALRAEPEWKPEVPMPENPRWFSPPLYGLKTYGDLFTPRQLVALTTFSDLVLEARDRIKRDALAIGLADDDTPLNDDGNGAPAYADAVAVYLGFLVSKLADKGSTLCTWDVGPSSNRTASGRSARVATVRVTFGRQALPMTWDFAEVNFFSESVGSIETVLKTLSTTLMYFSPCRHGGRAQQAEAQNQSNSCGRVISTDPPYYDNIGYADLSDFFYVWLRRTLRAVFPNLFTTLAVPKAEELVATPYRHGGKEQAEAFFLIGMTQAMHRLAEQSHPAFPVTIYYAFKQSETSSGAGTTSTGWETFLDAVIQAGFAISGTWPMRTEMGNRMIGSGTNALASSIILVCRRRPETPATATRREFLTALKFELPIALAHLQRGNIAPVDLAQSAIGPGMAVYTRYSKVVDAEGKTVSVRDALALINEVLDEAMAEQEGDFDSDTRWALVWFEQVGFNDGAYGDAEQLSKAKNTSITGLEQAGILSSKGGKVRLFRPADFSAAWDPTTDSRLTVWEMVHHLIRVLEAEGETAAANLVALLGAKAEVARELAYRLYTLCERKKRAVEAMSYNGLVQSWPEIVRLSRDLQPEPPAQGALL